MIQSLLHLAAYTTYDTTQSVQVSDGAMAMFFVILLAIALASYAIGAFLLSRIFVKAGLPAWKAWVPVYSTWKTFEIGGQNGLWTLLFFIPIANIIPAIILIVAYYYIGLKLGKQGIFVLWAIFLPIVWLVWLAFDDSKWQTPDRSIPAGIPTGTPTPIA
ncbi:MAG: DUF5684 domain-containing protein [Candidatus Saccharimonadales bacterium]